MLVEKDFALINFLQTKGCDPLVHTSGFDHVEAINDVVSMLKICFYRGHHQLNSAAVSISF